jgi:hypothetical protein
MRPREFISLFGGVGWPVRGRRAAGGQGTDHRILGRGDSCDREPMGAAFMQRLRELDWVNGRKVATSKH